MPAVEIAAEPEEAGESIALRSTRHRRRNHIGAAAQKAIAGVPRNGRPKPHKRPPRPIVGVKTWNVMA